MIRKANSIFAVFFLLYFVFYAVSPLSSALLCERPDVADLQSAFPETVLSPFGALAPFTETTSVKEQQANQVDPLIFDMALWAILKKGRPACDAGRDKLFVEKTGPKNFPEKVNCCVIESVGVLSVPFPKVISGVLTDHIPTYITPLLNSGLSPPLA